MTAVAERTDSWLAQFTGRTPGLPWMEQLRESAFARFSEIGFPTTRDEQWRFTNVSPIANTAFDRAPQAAADPDALVPYSKGIRLTFVNGRLQEPAPAVPAGVELGVCGPAARPYFSCLTDRHADAFVALNTVLFADAAWIRVSRGVKVEQPIHLVYVTVAAQNPVAWHPRALIVLEEQSRCSIVETHVGAGAYLSNAVTEANVGAEAQLDHYKIQLDSPEAFHMATVQADVSHGAMYSTTAVSLGASLARNHSGARLSKGAVAHLRGLYLVKGTRHTDHHVTVDHAEPDAQSHQLYKGILDGSSTAVFNGKILVRKDAQKTDAKQTNKNLILSEDAVVYAKPELQILADDVRCTHGATVGQLDAEAAFYLRSRGVAKDDALNILTCAFAQDIIDRIEIPVLRDALEQIVAERLYAGR
jgi:Fe-S cluster assembly protein SufD